MFAEVAHSITLLISMRTTKMRFFSIHPVELIAGSLARRQRRLVEARAELNQVELRVDWQRLQEGQTPAPIEPFILGSRETHMAFCQGFSSPSERHGWCWNIVLGFLLLCVIPNPAFPQSKAATESKRTAQSKTASQTKSVAKTSSAAQPPTVLDARKEARILKTLDVPRTDDSEEKKQQFAEHMARLSAALGAMKDAGVPESIREPYEALYSAWLRRQIAVNDTRLSYLAKDNCSRQCELHYLSGSDVRQCRASCENEHKPRIEAAMERELRTFVLILEHYSKLGL